MRIQQTKTTTNPTFLFVVALCCVWFSSSSISGNSGPFVQGEEIAVDDSGGTATAEKLHQRLKEEDTRLWGSTTATATSTEKEAANNHSTPFVPKPSSSVAAAAAAAASSTTATPGPGATTSHNIPQQYEPPQGFRITSRVYTDPEDKLAHFDNDSAIVFPYWECGVAGSTTVPIPLQHATVRHLLGGSKPNLYSGEEFGPHPQLVIALTSLEVVLNSGQVQIFEPGDVILLEDVLSGGHKLKGYDQHDMTVMILTLPQHYHQVGKDKSSLKDILVKSKAKINPCPTGSDKKKNNNNNAFAMEGGSSDTDSTSSSLSSSFGMVQQKVGNALQQLHPRSIRKYFLTVIGLTISTLVGDFLGKVAPLWLAVVFGGGCFVAGSTYGFVKVGDYCLDSLEIWQERQQLRLQDTPSDHNKKFDGNDNNDGDGSRGGVDDDDDDDDDNDIKELEKEVQEMEKEVHERANSKSTTTTTSTIPGTANPSA